MPDAKLAVRGTIHNNEVKVDLNGPAPDYVFKSDYHLPTLAQIKSFIKANGHLPEVPSAEQMEDKGVNLGEMNMLLLKKIEELTLQLIKKDQEFSKLKSRISNVERKLKLIK